MDTTTFAQKIKAKYPAYQSVDDATLVSKFLEKYPVYKSQVKIEPTVIENISTDLQQRGQNISDINKLRTEGQSVTGEILNAVAPNSLNKVKSTIGTAQKIRERLGLGNQIAPLGQVAGGINDVIGEVIGAIVPEKLKQFGAEKVQQLLGTAGIDTIEKYNQWAAENPLTAKNLEGAVNIASLYPTGKAAEVTGGSTIKYTTGKIADTFNEAKSLISKAETSAPEISTSIMNRVARVKPTEARQFEKISGESIGSYLTKTGNFGTPDEIVMKEAEKFLASKNSVDEALSSLPGKYSSPEITKPLDELIARAQRTEDPELSKYIGLKNKLETGGLDMSEINTVKRDFERKYKFSFNKLNSPEQLDRATNMDNQLRNWQFKKADELGFQNLSEINKQTQISKAIVDSLGGKITDNALLNNMSLTDWIMVSGGDPTAVGGLLVKKVFSDPGVQSKIAKYLAGGDIVGIKKPIIGETKLPRLNPGVVDKPTVGTGSTIPVAPAGSNIEFTGQVGGVNRTKPTQQLPKEKLKSASSTVSSKKKVMSSNLSKLEQEAKKYKSAEEFVKAYKTIPDYAMAHRPSKTGAFASDITKGGEFMPKDMYTNPEWYADMSDETYKESFSVLKKIKGKPNAEITIYRSSPKNELKYGDWVTLSKKYADQEGAREGVKTYSYKVKAKDIQFAGDDINEFGYYPSDETIKEKWVSLQPKTNNPKDYKSAEEFVKAQGTPVYHGAKAKFDTFDLSKVKNAQFGQAMYATDIENIASKYGENVKSFMVSNKDKIIDIKEIGGVEGYYNLAKKLYEKETGKIFKPARGNFKSGMDDWYYFKEVNKPKNIILKNKINKELQTRGILGLKLPQVDGDITYVVFDPSKIKTKSQLEDIWKKANKK